MENNSHMRAAATCEGVSEKDRKNGGAGVIQNDFRLNADTSAKRPDPCEPKSSTQPAISLGGRPEDALIAAADRLKKELARNCGGDLRVISGGDFIGDWRDF